MATILVLHNQLAKSGILCEMLEKLQHKVVEAESVSSQISKSASRFADLNTEIVIIDHEGDDISVIESLTAVKKEKCFSAIPVVVATAVAKSEEVIEAMRLGAFDHMSKPIDMRELESVINRALTTPKPEAVSQISQSNEEFLVGLSPVMRRVEKLIGVAAGCDATVLVQGETGTGKDTVARTIHRHSPHQKETLTVIDCTAVPEDYESFESLSPGAQGSVLLDEIGDLNAQMQAMLVRALKEQSPSSDLQPRIIATTQYDLIAMVKEKRFREDLYYRLNVLPILLPPLRERGSDILSLAETFLQQARPEAAKRLSSSAAKLLLDYTWPGNVRELQNLMYHLTVAVRSAVIEAADLSMIASSQPGASDDSALPSLDYHDVMSSVEKRLLAQALQAASGSRSEAARLLGINRQLLYAKLKAHGLMS